MKIPPKWPVHVVPKVLLALLAPSHPGIFGEF
jgi:hypothetical protein